MSPAELALQWLGAVLSFWKRLMKRAVKVKRYVRDLYELEEHGSGRNTEAWKKINEATGDITLSFEEVIYLRDFKLLWDKYLKTPMRTIADALAPDEDEDE